MNLFFYFTPYNKEIFHDKMVSTRRVHSDTFVEGEKVLCYEPDITKVKVLYDAKVLEVIEVKDKRSRKTTEYLIHFQGWSSSWDRRVPDEFVLKDTPENRLLQKELAEKSQLQLGAYLYRKEARKKRKRKLSERVGELINNNENLSVSATTSENVSPENVPQPPLEALPELDIDYYSSSVESSQEEEKVYMQMGDILKARLEFDYNLITKEHKLVNLPAKVPVIAILENFVRHFALKQVCGISPDPSKSKRRNSQAKFENRREKELEHMKKNIELAKEVADGLRIYFDFTLKSYLLYEQEKKQAEVMLLPGNLKHFTYVAADNLVPSNITVTSEIVPKTPVKTEPESHPNPPELSHTNPTSTSDRRLRSHHDPEPEPVNRQETLSSMASTSSDCSTPHASSMSSTMDIFRSALPMNIGVTKQAKAILDEAFAWRLLPPGAPGAPCMIYGSIHLTRLLIKLPEFLNSSTLNDEKIKTLLKYLDSVAEYLESHEELFGKQFYSICGSDDEDTILQLSSDNETPARRTRFSHEGSQSENEVTPKRKTPVKRSL